ncbi:type III secretion protein [Shewanella sp. DC2-4]|uniref:type III secretion protein n=1 Tax=Shewanella sp. DC2-4 TaxID=2739431 RepID=UPI00156629DA|nr:type III secretion protein [Shewanella sp. DC2-4]NRD33299.1 type III secretion protein [Shewanella sp. DC2-4]
MNPFLIEVRPCELRREGHHLISATALHRASELADMEHLVRTRIAKALKKARRQRDAAQTRSEQILEQAQQDAQALSAQWQQQAKAVAIDEAISWHYNEAQLIQSLTDKLHANIAEKIKKVLTTWMQEHELSAFLIKRLSDQVCERVGQGALTLLVSNDDFAALAKAFDGRMTVQVSAELVSGQAELSSSTMTAKIDLNEHLQQLLAAFVPEPLKGVG